MAIGHRVEELRKRARMSQTELAAAIGVHQQTIAKIEAGARPLRLSEGSEIADTLGLPLQALDVAENEGLQDLLEALREARQARDALSLALGRLEEVAAAVYDTPIPDETWREVDTFFAIVRAGVANAEREYVVNGRRGDVDGFDPEKA